MTLTIYHNPRCSKSRATLALLRGHGVEPQIIEYLKTPPTVAQLRRLLALLQAPPTALIRFQEPVAKTLALAADDARSDDDWLRLIREHPILMERPLVADADRAVIGRPPENALALLRG